MFGTHRRQQAEQLVSTASSLRLRAARWLVIGVSVAGMLAAAASLVLVWTATADTPLPERINKSAVEEVAILGFPNEQWGEAPHAFVVLHEGAHADERELREFARANLAHFKAPHSVTFVKELPKTATGKIQKYILRAQRPAIAPQ
jgi:acyl-CoA synthetase (AMP-forming)/AMP-acid ligase II